MQLLIHVQTCTQMLVIICAIYENNLSRNGTIKNYNSWLTVHWLYLFKCFPDVVFLRSSLVEVDGHGILSGVHLRLQTHWGTKYEWTTKSHTVLTHWGRVTHICVAKLTITGSDNGLSPGRCQAIIWTSDGILLIGPLGTNFNEFLIGIQIFPFQTMYSKMSSVKWHPFCLGLNVLTTKTGYAKYTWHGLWYKR